MLTAITRAVSPTLADCQLEHFARQPIDVSKAMEQHRGYQACLADLGARVIALPAAAECPDGVFVEDPALVLDEIAIVTRMGNVTRRAESESLAAAVGQFREMNRMTAPATLEGGDVMRIGRTLYVGLSRRTNREGVEQLAAMIEPLGYRVIPVRVLGCLHLKSACCFLGDGTILANREWIDASPLSDFRILDLPANEPGGANVLRIGDTVIVPAAFPSTEEALQRAGFRTRAIDTSELIKAEAGVTCMSLIFNASI